MASSSSNVVGVHYRVGKKIGEGSFGVIFEGTNLLNNQQVAIKFVRTRLTTSLWPPNADVVIRNLARVMHLNCEMSIEHTRFSLAAVRPTLQMTLNETDSLQLAFPMSTTSDRKVFTISSSLTSSDPVWKTCSTTATEDFQRRLW